MFENYFNTFVSIKKIKKQYLLWTHPVKGRKDQLVGFPRAGGAGIMRGDHVDGGVFPPLFLPCLWEK